MRRCRQCGKAKPDNGWTVCAACFDANIAYRKASDALARRMHRDFQQSPPSPMRPHELRRPSEMRGRKARPAYLAPYLKDIEDDE